MGFDPLTSFREYLYTITHKHKRAQVGLCVRSIVHRVRGKFL